VSITNTHAFNAAFAAAQLAARIESPGQVSTSEKIAAAAVGIADAEAKGIDWGQVGFDSVCDSVARMIKDRLITSDYGLEYVRQDAGRITREAGGAK
jgi:hypothetical protein